MKKLFCFVIPILLFCSCIETVSIDKVPVNKVLVVNSLITPDSLFCCEVSKVYAINDTTDHTVNNAEVEIYNNQTNELVCQLVTAGKGSYKAISEKPQQGIEYRIEVVAPDYPTVTGITTIPSKPFAKDVSVINYAGYEALINDDYAELRFNIDDRFAEPNFFEVTFIHFLCTNKDWYMSGTKYDKEIIYNDSIYHIRNYKGFSDYSLVDAVIKAEGLMKYKPSTLLLTDNLFNLNAHSFVVRSCSDGGRANAFICYSLTEDLYKFRTTLLQHQYEQGAKGISRFDDMAGLDFSSKAIDVYSNLTGGYGIFSGYNTQILYSQIDSSELLPDGRKIVYLDKTTNPYE